MGWSSTYENILERNNSGRYYADISEEQRQSILARRREKDRNKVFKNQVPKVSYDEYRAMIDRMRNDREQKFRRFQL